MTSSRLSRMRSLRGLRTQLDSGAGAQPLVFSIQHFCLHDGPGVRSLVFFKGCPLRCVWCQNPESWSTEQELGFKAHLCINCQTCVNVCSEKAMLAVGKRDRNRCRLCFTCASRCLTGALVCFGTPQTVESIMEELRPEYPFFRSSGGGVTFTGGEPTMHAGFVAELARSLRSEGIHLAMETCGQFNIGGDLQPGKPSAGESQNRRRGLEGPVWDLLSNIDLVLFDLKVFDDAQHRRLCGMGNADIKRNFHILATLAARGHGPVLWPRLPIIPELTDTSENLEGWAGFLKENELFQLTLIPYHNLGESKRTWLGIKPGSKLKANIDKALTAAQQVLAQEGITCYPPGEEDWPDST